jgi:hypothetical protein
MGIRHTTVRTGLENWIRELELGVQREIVEEKLEVSL